MDMAAFQPTEECRWRGQLRTPYWTREPRADAFRARGKPYYRSLEPGLHLGYRKPLAGSGKWVARHYIGDQSYEVESLATADDHSDADGEAILDYRQAQAKARERMVGRAHAAAGKTGPLTVRAVMEAYLEFLESNRESGGTARYSINAFILPELGDIEADSLTVDQLRNWHKKIANAPARQRTRPGAKQNYRKNQDDPDWQRRLKSTANRILKILKGGLNYAWNDKKLKSDDAWRRVKLYKDVESARVRYLTIDEAQRLIGASVPTFGYWLKVRCRLERDTANSRVLKWKTLTSMPALLWFTNLKAGSHGTSC